MAQKWWWGGIIWHIWQDENWSSAGIKEASERPSLSSFQKVSPGFFFFFCVCLFVCGYRIEQKWRRERGISQRLWKIRPRRTNSSWDWLGMKGQKMATHKRSDSAKMYDLSMAVGGRGGELFSNLITRSKCLTLVLIQVSPMRQGRRGGRGTKKRGNLIAGQKKAWCIQSTSYLPPLNYTISVLITVCNQPTGWLSFHSLPEASALQKTSDGIFIPTRRIKRQSISVAWVNLDSNFQSLRQQRGIKLAEKWQRVKG